MPIANAAADVPAPLLPPAVKDPCALSDHDPRIVGEQVRLLFRNAPASIGTTVAIAVIVYGFMANVSLPYAGTWLGWALLVSAWRGQMVWQYKRAGETPVDPARWIDRKSVV